MARRLLLVLPLLLLAARPALAERVQVFSIRGADGAGVETQLKKALRVVKGVKKAQFDRVKVELTVKLDDAVSDEVVVAAVRAVGLEAIPGAGQGEYLPQAEYPAGADVAVLSPDGRAVGSLEKQRVAGKYTVFDVFADWCAPCRLVDARLREIVSQRPDVAVRKLNVVDFETPLASELGPEFQSLPYLIVFSPSGKRVEVHGADLPRLDKALARP